MMTDIIYNVLISVISTLVYTMLIFIIISLIHLLRRSNIMKNIRRVYYPPKRVFTTDQKPLSFNLGKKGQFKSIYTDDEIKFLLHADKKKNLFNGRSIRLDSMKNGVCKLSIVGFFDFLTTNLTYLPASKNLKSIKSTLYDLMYNDAFKKEKYLQHRIKECIKSYGKLNSFEKVLAVDELANIVTVSVLLEDTNGNFLLVKRGKNVAISSGNFAVSCAGSVAEEDLEAHNPFLECAQRELKEELGLRTFLTLDEIVISKQKLQPAVLFSGKVDKPFKELYTTFIQAKDFQEENSKVFAIPKECILSALSHYQFTDVAAYQLFSKCELKHKYKWVCFMLKKYDISKYEIRS